MIFKLFNRSNESSKFFICAGIIVSLIFIILPVGVGTSLLFNLMGSLMFYFLLIYDINKKNIAISYFLSSSITYIIISELLKFEGIKYPFYIFVIAILIMIEALFLLDKTKPKDDENVFYFTIKRKSEAFIELIIIFSVINLILKTILSIDYETLHTYLQNDLKYIIITIFVIFGLYLYIWVNSLRYRRKK